MSRQSLKQACLIEWMSDKKAKSKRSLILKGFGYGSPPRKTANEMSRQSLKQACLIERMSVKKAKQTRSVCLKGFG
jgi:hypothetical protein